MKRLSRFEGYRFIGTREDMLVYDCDQDEEFEALRTRVEEGDMIRRNQLQAFSPDTLTEAENRGFRALRAMPRDGQEPAQASKP